MYLCETGLSCSLDGWMDGWMYVCGQEKNVCNNNKNIYNVFHHKGKKRKKRIIWFETFYKVILCHFLYHIAGMAAKPHAVNPRKMARVTSPSSRLSGKKDFAKKKKAKNYF